MATEVIVAASTRDTAVKARDTRNAGNIPAVLYGKAAKQPTPIQVEYQEFRKAYRISGDSTVLTLDLDGKKVTTLVHDVQYSPVYDEYTHLDFYQVDEKEEVKTQIPIILEGLAPAVKTQNGVLVAPTKFVEISCLPKFLIREITVDISGLENFHDTIKISDLEISENKNVTILASPDTVIASITTPKGGTTDEDEEATEGEEEASEEKAAE